MTLYEGKERSGKETGMTDRHFQYNLFYNFGFIIMNNLNMIFKLSKKF